jgi:hypothetical protein
MQARIEADKNIQGLTWQNEKIFEELISIGNNGNPMISVHCSAETFISSNTPYTLFTLQMLGVGLPN